MKANELRKLSEDELQKRLYELLKEQFNLRMQKGSDQLNRHSQFKAVRRDIARVKTIVSQKRAQQQSARVEA
jgi:large subunit ribosomal protein L29